MNTAECQCRRWGFSDWRVEKTRWGMRFFCPHCGRLYGYQPLAEYNAAQKKKETLLKENQGENRES